MRTPTSWLRSRFPCRGLWVALVVTLAALASAPSAFAETPWWHLTLGTRPASLRPVPASDEVQELTITPEEGLGALFELQIQQRELTSHGKNLGVLATEPLASELSELGVLPITAANIQAALETMYVKGSVIVTEEPEGPGEVKHFLVRSPGHAVSPIEVVPFFGSAEAKVISKGRSTNQLVATFANLGDAPLSGGECIKLATATGRYGNSECTEEAAPPGTGEFEANPVRLTDTLPKGLRALNVSVTSGQSQESAGRVECTLESGGSRIGCTFAHTLNPYEQIELVIAVALDEEVAGAVNQIAVAGANAQAASLARPVSEGRDIPFGVEEFEVTPEEAGGKIDTQAGSHPFQTTFSVTLDQQLQDNISGELQGEPEPVEPQLPKNLNVKLPPGLIGNPTAIPRCPPSAFLHQSCGANTVVGVAMTTINESARAFPLATVSTPVFNLEPNVGEPARFGFMPGLVPVFLDTSLRTGGDYGVTVNVENITQSTTFFASKVTVWGVPGDAAHDSSRGGCVNGEFGTCAPLGQTNPPPFFTLPTACPTDPATGKPEPMRAEIELSSWSDPTHPQSFPATSPLPALDGCNQLPFTPSIQVKPDSEQASKPSGLTVHVHVNQNGQTSAEGLADSSVQNITVTLPEGVTINPSAADGLAACPESQVGYLPAESHPPGDLHFTAKLPSPLQPGVNFCSDAAKIATVKIKTPLLPNSLDGAVYLASPQNFAGPPPENPFESLIAMYIVAEDPVSGSLVKLPGRVSLSQATGQIETTFENTPQVAFEDAELHFFGGERAPLSTPALCRRPGEPGYRSVATFAPWSGNSPVTATSEFNITSGPNGSPCPNPPGNQSASTLPFSPTLSSQTTNVNAGSFTPLSTTLSRDDGQQDISAVTLHFPPGLSGILSGVKLCGEAEANTGTCSPDSLIGETIVSVGLGGDPFSVTGGRVYLTGPYHGAPFGLSIVNPAKAGPFNLQQGRPVVVRAKIEVDLHTAALTVATNERGDGYAIPTMIDGIPLQIKHVNVNVNRPGFTFNPTSCNPMQITGSISSAQGASSPVSVPFQIANCANLRFTPKFTVSASGKTSKANGASLSVKLVYPRAPFGSEANIVGVKVELPKQLPSRLTTLQKACTAAQFAANPAGCPAASIVGHAIVHTPLLPVPLEGPAYFVSNGGQAFPNLIMVLQGYGVTVHLVGDTFISKAGITSSTFRSTPDVPFSSFALTLPKGRFSALTANANLCAPTRSIKVRKHLTVRRRGHTVHLVRSVRKLVPAQLVMPTIIIAQNGAQIRQSTKISVTECHKTKKARKASPKKSRGKRRS
jgi:hypothetical protein